VPGPLALPSVNTGSETQATLNTVSKAQRQPAGVLVCVASVKAGWQAFDEGDRMSARTLAVLVAGAFGLASATLAADPPKAAFGKDQFNARCASCHGVSGKGNGPVAKQIGTTVPDLTTYAKRNGGKFPVELAWMKIDGRPVSFDTERNMPVWGRDFRHEAIANVDAKAKHESYVAAEIAAIVEYMKTIQVK
jgi:mono/diheme cytochrome c family protein